MNRPCVITVYFYILLRSNDNDDKNVGIASLLPTFLAQSECATVLKESYTEFNCIYSLDAEVYKDFILPALFSSHLLGETVETDETDKTKSYEYLKPAIETIDSYFYESDSVLLRMQEILRQNNILHVPKNPYGNKKFFGDINPALIKKMEDYRLKLYCTRPVNICIMSSYFEPNELEVKTSTFFHFLDSLGIL